MRKLLLLAAILTLVASQSLAVTSIRNTKHDLSSSSTATIKSDNYDELCIFCHTPHMAIDQSNAPLWNRLGTDSIAITDYYNSATLDTASKEATVSSEIAASDVPLCLSCHDGSSLTNDLQNPSNAEGGAQPTGIGALSASANIGTDLHDDHPIGMLYDTIYDNTPDEFKSASATGMNFYNGVMWCSSCHDVHDNTYAPFLAADNAGSGLCLSCHIK